MKNDVLGKCDYIFNCASVCPVHIGSDISIARSRARGDVAPL